MIRRELRRRNAIEPLIGHMKTDDRLDRWQRSSCSATECRAWASTRMRSGTCTPVSALQARNCEWSLNASIQRALARSTRVNGPF
jgi:hypothetical protein